MFHNLLNSLLELLFPDRCAGCKRTGALLCARCRDVLNIYTGTVRRLPALDGVSIAYVYQGPLRDAIHQLKYRRRRRMAGPLGELLVPFARPHAATLDAIIPIPMHAARYAERGFNQAELIAQTVAAGVQIPCLGSSITRVRATAQQAKLNAQERQQNMRGAFAWKGGTPPARVLLIDDVLTTGATMDACAQTLREAGSREVYGLALARSRPDLQ